MLFGDAVAVIEHFIEFFADGDLVDEFCKRSAFEFVMNRVTEDAITFILNEIVVVRPGFEG